MTEVGKIGIEYLTSPQGIVREFISYLAANAIRLGVGSSVDFYLKRGMEEQAAAFLTRTPVEQEESEALTAWINSLPWNPVGYLVLAFNW